MQITDLTTNYSHISCVIWNWGYSMWNEVALVTWLLKMYSGLQILLFIFVKYIKSKLSLRTVCSYHVIYAFQSESTRYSCLNVKELLTRSRCEIWGLSDCNLTHNSTLTTENSRLASLAKWLSVRSWTKWFCGFEPSCSHLHHIACVEDGIWIKNLKESNSRKRRVTTFIRSSFIQVSNW